MLCPHCDGHAHTSKCEHTCHALTTMAMPAPNTHTMPLLPCPHCDGHAHTFKCEHACHALTMMAMPAQNTHAMPTLRCPYHDGHACSGIPLSSCSCAMSFILTQQTHNCYVPTALALPAAGMPLPSYSCAMSPVLIQVHYTLMLGPYCDGDASSGTPLLSCYAMLPVLTQRAHHALMLCLYRDGHACSWDAAAVLLLCSVTRAAAAVVAALLPCLQHLVQLLEQGQACHAINNGTDQAVVGFGCCVCCAPPPAQMGNTASTQCKHMPCHQKWHRSGHPGSPVLYLQCPSSCTDG
eukprot:1158508-Pelagomonas_calceolata.AAC.39